MPFRQLPRDWQHRALGLHELPFRAVAEPDWRDLLPGMQHRGVVPGRRRVQGGPHRVGVQRVYQGLVHFPRLVLPLPEKRAILLAYFHGRRAVRRRDYHVSVRGQAWEVDAQRGRDEEASEEAVGEGRTQTRGESGRHSVHRDVYHLPPNSESDDRRANSVAWSDHRVFHRPRSHDQL